MGSRRCCGWRRHDRGSGLHECRLCNWASAVLKISHEGAEIENLGNQVKPNCDHETGCNVLAAPSLVDESKNEKVLEQLVVRQPLEKGRGFREASPCTNHGG